MLRIFKKNNQRAFYCASVQPSDALSFLWISSISTRPVLIITGKKGLSYIYDYDDDFIVLRFFFFFFLYTFTVTVDIALHFMVFILPSFIANQPHFYTTPLPILPFTILLPPQRRNFTTAGI